MKKSTLAVILLFLGFYLNAQSIYTPEYSLTLPGTPTVNEEQVVTEAGTALIKMYQVLHEGSLILMLDSTYPNELNISASEEVALKILKNSKEGSIQNLASQLGQSAIVIKEESTLFQDKLIALHSVSKVGPYYAVVYNFAKKHKLFSILVFSETLEKAENISSGIKSTFKFRT